MSLSSLAYLGALRQLSQMRADLQNSQHITTQEWNSMITLSAKELIDILVGAYGNDYSVQVPYQFTVNGTQLYGLPSDFYKLLGVDLQYGASPTGWVTLKKFEFIERNKYSWLNPLPISASVVQLWYVPNPESLQFIPMCSTTSSSGTIGVSDVTDLLVGMSVAGSGIPSGATIGSINTSNNTITLANSITATLTQPYVALFMWRDDASIDGIAGWEEFIIIDAAIKALIKQERPIDALVLQKNAMKARIEAMAEGRDAGQAHHVSDVISINTPIITTGATNLKYRLLGTQIQFIPCGYEEGNDGIAGFQGMY